MRAASLLVVAAFGACGPTVIWSGHTADRQRRIDVVQQGGLDYVAIDGERRAAYHGIAGWSVQTAGSHIAFAARVNHAWLVVRDGVAGPAFDAIGAIVLDDTGACAYAARHGGRWQIVDARGASPPYDAILDGSLQITDGHVGYVAEQARHVHAVIDGAAGPAYDAIGDLIVTADGAAYTARTGDDAYVVANGTPSERWGAVARLAVSHGHVAYAASGGAGWHVVHDADVGPTVDTVEELVLGADGTAVAWSGTIASATVVALGDQPLASWPGTSRARVALSPRGSLAFVAPVDTGGEQVIADGHAGAIYDEIRRPAWSASGMLAYAARRGATWLLVAGDREVVQATALGDPVWSATGRLGIVAKRGRDTLIVVDGHEYKVDLAFEDSLAFSADGAHWAAIAGDLAHERLYIWVDGARAIALPSHELYSAAASQPPDVLRAWVAAELARDSLPSRR